MATDTLNGWTIEQAGSALVVTTPRCYTTRVVQDRGWIARIAGTDERFGLKREFCENLTRTKTAATGQVNTFVLKGEGHYEYRGIFRGAAANAYMRGDSLNGLFRVAGGQLAEVSKAEAIAAAQGAAK